MGCGDDRLVRGGTGDANPKVFIQASDQPERIPTHRDWLKAGAAQLLRQYAGIS